MDGYDDPLAEIEDDPDAPEEAGAEEAATPTPRAWTRFLARMVDVVLFAFCFGVAVSFLQLEWVAQQGKAVLGIAVYGLWVPIEAVFLAAGGMTPGKWLLGTRVRSRTGSPPSLGTALLRSLLVWTVGLGLGIPCLQMIGMFAARWRLDAKGCTLWDQACKCEVEHREIGKLRFAISIVIVVGALVLGIVLKAIEDFEAGSGR